MDGSNHCEMSLLEQLRKKAFKAESHLTNLLRDEKKTKEELQSTMDLIINHQQELPLTLRQSIAAMVLNEDVDPLAFLHKFHDALVHLLMGRTEIRKCKFSDEWHGVNSDVDTEEEVELAFRVYVQLFGKDLEWYSCLPHNSSPAPTPIRLLASSNKAVSFIPLVMRLIDDEVWYYYEFHGVCERRHFWRDLGRLFCNDFLRDLGRLAFVRGYMPFPDFGEAPFALITRMREEGSVEDADIVHFLWALLDVGVERGYTFVETRLRYLVDWNPKLLMRCEHYTSYLELFLMSTKQARVNGDLEYQTSLRIFALVTELGMTHYPLALGFVFHDSEYSNVRPSYPTACRIYGSKVVLKIVTEKISLALGHFTKSTNVHKRKRTSSTNDSNSHCNSNITSKELLLYAVATNKEIFRDGVYTLLRCDPSLISRR